MTPTEGKTITLKGKTYTLRFTLPRLRELSQRSGKGLYNLNLESLTLNTETLILLLWAAIAHPANDMQKATVDQVADLLDVQDLRPASQAINEVLQEILKPTENPPTPIVQ